MVRRSGSPGIFRRDPRRCQRPAGQTGQPGRPQESQQRQRVPQDPSKHRPQVLAPAPRRHPETVHREAAEAHRAVRREGDFMMIVDYATDLFFHSFLTIRNKVYIRNNNLEIDSLGYDISIKELNTSISYNFRHDCSGDFIDKINNMFKIDDIDLAIYCMINTYHKAINKGYDGKCAVINHPQYMRFVNTGDFNLVDIVKVDEILFNPMREEKKQNLNTRITANKLAKAILAGQVDKVICNGNTTDDWERDASANNWKGEWDKLDFAEHIWGHSSSFYNISKEGNVLRVFSILVDFSEIIPYI